MNKSIEELIQRLKEPDYQYYGWELSKDEAELVISALEKQIPKKTRGISLTHEGRAGNCPCCGKFIAELENKHFCDHERCGQAIDWRNEDE